MNKIKNLIFWARIIPGSVIFGIKLKREQERWRKERIIAQEAAVAEDGKGF